MASDYRASGGHGVALVSLTVLNPQPASIGFRNTERSYGLSGAVYEQAPYIELNWSMVEDATQYGNILSAFGLTSVLYANVTVYIPNANYAYARYNAVSVRPMIGQDGGRSNFFLRDFTILLKNLVAL